MTGHHIIQDYSQALRDAASMEDWQKVCTLDRKFRLCLDSYLNGLNDDQLPEAHRQLSSALDNYRQIIQQFNQHQQRVRLQSQNITTGKRATRAYLSQ